MTAIVSAYTPQGFVIGADGLRRDSVGRVVSETVQKIFHVKHGEVSIAYAWTGATVLHDSNGGIIFDFIQQSELTSDGLGNVHLGALCGFQEYLSRFLAELYQSFVKNNDGSLLSGEISGLPKDEIARAVFVGYCHGTSYRAKVSFPRRDATVLKPCLMELRSEPFDFDTFSAPTRMNASFREERLKWGPGTLANALLLVRDYIQLCIDNPEQDKECEAIGGHIHIASVTPDKGFEWLIPPKPSA